MRSIDMAELFKSGVVHTKLWIVDGVHAYIGSANMDYRSLTQALSHAVISYEETTTRTPNGIL